MRQLKFFLMIIFLSGCSLIKHSALSLTGSLIADGSDEVFTEGNLDYFKKSVPGNLKLIEGLWFADQENEVLLLMLIKGHAGHTFAAVETNSYSEILLEETSDKRELTILGYEKAVFYGLKYLALKGISKKDFYKKDLPESLTQNFNNKMDASDLPAIFYFAQALGSSINMQRQNIAKMGQLNHVKSMLDWVCDKDPTMENGNCVLFRTIVEASTPTILGGNPGKAKLMFQSLIKQYPENLLIRLSYIQFHLIPLLEEADYLIEMQNLKKDISHWYQLQLGNETSQNKRFMEKREYNLYNAVTRERFRILKGLEREIF